MLKEQLRLFFSECGCGYGRYSEATDSSLWPIVTYFIMKRVLSSDNSMQNSFWN